MPKTVLRIDVVEVTRKKEILGYKVYITDDVHNTKLPRKPGDLKGRDPVPGEYVPVDYYPITAVGAVIQALEDYQIWVSQGYKRIQ